MKNDNSKNYKRKETPEHRKTVKKYLSTTSPEQRELASPPSIRRPVSGYEGLYEVDYYGNVYSCYRQVDVNVNGKEYKRIVGGHKLKQRINKKGYKTVTLSKNRVYKPKQVHRIVAQAFIPNPNNYPVVNHKDENPLNNYFTNLEWCTSLYNNNYGTINERRSATMRMKKQKKELGKNSEDQSITAVDETETTVHVAEDKEDGDTK